MQCWQVMGSEPYGGLSLIFCRNFPGFFAKELAMRAQITVIEGKFQPKTIPPAPAGLSEAAVRWTPLAGQFGGLVKLGSRCRQAANFSVSVAP